MTVIRDVSAENKRSDPSPQPSPEKDKPLQAQYLQGLSDLIRTRSRDRTGTSITGNWILSPTRLPIPPPGLAHSFEF